MSDLAVSKWKQQGAVAVWRAPSEKGQPLHISADDAGCDSLLKLFHLMESGKYSSKRTVTLVKPKKDAYGGYYDNNYFQTLVIKYPKDQVDDNYFSRTIVEGKIYFELGLNKLRELKDCVIDIKKGNGDYCIWHGENELWIWWWLE